MEEGLKGEVKELIRIHQIFDKIYKKYSKTILLLKLSSHFIVKDELCSQIYKIKKFFWLLFCMGNAVILKGSLQIHKNMLLMGVVLIKLLSGD